MLARPAVVAAVPVVGHVNSLTSQLGSEANGGSNRSHEMIMIMIMISQGLIQIQKMTYLYTPRNHQTTFVQTKIDARISPES